MLRIMGQELFGYGGYRYRYTNNTDGKMEKEETEGEDVESSDCSNNEIFYRQEVRFNTSECQC